MKIPAANPLASYERHRAPIDAAVLQTLKRGLYILGPETAAFEKEFGRYLGAHAAGAASGTDALELALKCAGVKRGDAVITVSHTAAGTAAAIENAGALPFFTEIDPVSFTLDPASLERSLKKMPAALRKKIKAVVPVHLYGHPADMPAISSVAKKYGLAVVEDCAQSAGAELHGKKTGALADAAAFSFYPTKNLGALGDGGAVVSKHASMIEKARCLREYGWKKRYISSEPGGNSRLDEIQAAVLRVKLKHLDTENKRRREIADYYSVHLPDSLQVPVTGKGVKHAWHQYVVRSKNREALRWNLEKHGIGSLVHYPVPLHLQPAYKGRVPCAADGLRITEKICGEILSLPVYPELGQPEIAAVAAAVLKSV